MNPAVCGSIFPAKNCQDSWISVHQLARSQMNMEDETKLCSQIHSTFEAFVVWHASGCHCREDLGSFCWPILAPGVVVFSTSHRFFEYTSQIQWFHQDSGMFDFGKCFGAFQSNYWAGHCWWSHKIHILSHVTIQSRNGSLLSHRIREENISKWQFFWLMVSSWGTHFSSLFTFPTCFKWKMTIELSTLNFRATSYVVERGSASMILSVACCKLPTAGLIFKGLISFANLESPLHCTFISITGSNVLMLRVVSTALPHILNSNKKITQISFLLTSFPQSKIHIK